jgi:hypothetical protein
MATDGGRRYVLKQIASGQQDDAEQFQLYAQSFQHEASIYLLRPPTCRCAISSHRIISSCAGYIEGRTLADG